MDPFKLFVILVNVVQKLERKIRSKCKVHWFLIALENVCLPLNYETDLYREKRLFPEPNWQN